MTVQKDMDIILDSSALTAASGPRWHRQMQRINDIEPGWHRPWPLVSNPS